MKKKKEKKECWLFRYVIIHLTTARKESYRRKSERKMDYTWQLCKKSVRKSSTSSFFANLLFVFFIEEVLRIRIRKFRLDPWPEVGYKNGNGVERGDSFDPSLLQNQRTFPLWGKILIKNRLQRSIFPNFIYFISFEFYSLNFFSNPTLFDFIHYRIGLNSALSNLFQILLSIPSNFICLNFIVPNSTFFRILLFQILPFEALYPFKLFRIRILQFQILPFSLSFQTLSNSTLYNSTLSNFTHFWNHSKGSEK